MSTSSKPSTSQLALLTLAQSGGSVAEVRERFDFGWLHAGHASENETSLFFLVERMTTKHNRLGCGCD
jgi:hypothetical protein